MIEQIADLHIHSKYARACSPLLEIPNIAQACVEKGIDIVATGDFTHPAWFKHLEQNLEEIGESGLYRLKRDPLPPPPLWRGSGKPSPPQRRGQGEVSSVKFIFGTEVSCIYKHKDKVRRLHLLIYAPSMETARRLNAALDKRGVNRASDGRPIFGMSGKELLQMMLDIDERMLMIPAHAWTPWFAVFGSKSGYDSLAECFEELTPHIRAIETGLSSDPPMNHRLSRLDNITLISNSDAHSLPNLGREANVFSFADYTDVTYNEITRIIKTGDREKFLYTIEFYPEEGMYHFDGHRDCQVSLAPVETKKLKNICPICKKSLTVGVLNRVDALADRAEDKIPAAKFIPHRYIVPLKEIIAAALEVGKSSKKVEAEYRSLLGKLGSEFFILLHASIDAIKQAASDPNIAVGIENMRAGNVKVIPGYDGVYGQVEVLLDKRKFRPAQSRLF